MRRCCVQNEYWFNHWKPRLERLSHICQNSDHAICCHPRRFSAKKPQPRRWQRCKTFGDSLGKPLLAANQEVRQHRLNARMTAKQGPVCVGDPPPTFGDRHLWTPWHGVRLPVFHRLTFLAWWTARNRSFIEVDPNQFLVAKFLGHIGNGSPERLHLAKRRFGSQKSGKQDFKKWLKYNVLGP